MPRSTISLVVVLLVSPVAFGQAPSPLATYDETVLRQVGVGTDAASLLKLLHHYSHGNGDATRINAMIKQLGHGDFERRQHAAHDLITIGPSALDALREARQNNRDAEVRRSATVCIDDIENKFDANVVLSAVRWLSHLRAAGAAVPLLDILPYVDWQTQGEIFHGLPHVALREGKLDPVLLAAIDDKSPLRRAAAALTVALAGSDADRTHVRKRLTDADANVRLRAAQGLLAVHDPASLPVLIALLNERLVEISWSAEELLHWAAGDTAPTATVGGATAEEREKVVDAWTAWYEAYAAKFDWQQLDKTPRRPGVCLLSEGNSVWLCGCDGQPRWMLSNKFGAHDFVLLPNNELLVAPRNGDGHLLKCDLSGKEIWKHVDRNGDDIVTCQRLHNGTFFVATQAGIGKISATGQLFATRRLDDVNPGDAWMLRNGRILCRYNQGVALIGSFDGPIVRNSRAEEVQFNPLPKFAVMPDGRYVVADDRHNRLIEVDSDGKTLRIVKVHNSWCVEAMRTGNYLVSTFDDPRVIEVDPEGRTVWEVVTLEQAGRVRAVLETVRIGFNKPRPADFNLDSVAARVSGLKDADAAVRLRCAKLLTYLKPTDDSALAALNIALDDKERAVRSEATKALAEIGAPAVPCLLQTLKKGPANSRRAAADALYLIGPEAIDALGELTEMVRDDNNDSVVRSRAVAIIGAIGPKGIAALPVLLAALKGEDDLVRREAAFALTGVAPGDRRVVAGLVAAMKDGKYPDGRLAALQALRNHGIAAKAAIPDLVCVVKAPELSDAIREIATDALGSMGPGAKAAVPPLLDILKDAKQPVSVRRSAAKNLGSFGEHSKAALPVFSELLRDPKLPDELSSAVVKGLGAMGKDGVPLLGEAVKGGNVITRRMAIEQLVKLADVAKPALPALREAAKDTTDQINSRLASRAVIIIELSASNRDENIN